VSANAAPSFSLDDAGTILPDVSVGGETLDAGGTVDLGDSLGSLGAGSTQAGAGALASTSGDGAGAFADGRAIPVGLIVLLLALFPVLGSLGERFADAALAAGGASDACPFDSEGDRDG
jgi:hypothetical protein